MITTKIVFDRKKKAKKDGLGTLEVRLTVSRRSVYVSTGIRVRESEWKVGRIVNRPDAAVLNDRLVIIYEKVCKEANRCIETGEPVDGEAIRRKVWDVKADAGDDPTFLEWVESQIEMLTVAPGTRRQYRTLYNRLTEFDRMRKWQDVNAENISGFDSWLHKRNKVNTGTQASDAKLTDSAVFKYHRNLKALINRAVTFGKMQRNPYDLLRGRFKRGEKENVEYLTESEMQAIEHLELPAGDPMEVARDLFVFQMYTGLSFSDAQAFDFSQYRNIDGRWTNIGERIKTGVPFVSSLLPPAVAVLEKYGYRIPQVENHVYNRALKAVGIMAKIQIPLHSHLARHTFATWMLKSGAKIENVSRMLGHTNIRQTQRYAKVLAESVHEDFAMVARKMKKGE